MDMDRTPRPGEIFRHFKNKLYQVISVAEHTETGEKLVVYQALYGTYKIYARPFSMFVGEVDKEKYPQSEQKYRFEKVESEKLEEKTLDKADSKPETKTRQEPKSKSSCEPENTVLNPLLLPFVEAEDFQVKLEILDAMEGKVGQEDLDVLYEALDLPKKDGDIKGQMYSIKQYMEMRKKFDGKRLR